MSRNKKPISRRDDLVVQELNGEVLVYDLKTHKALCLNETSALVWNACDGTRDIGELRDYASAKMNSPVTDDLIWLAIDQLKKEDLLVDAPDAKSYFGGMSRREVVKRIGVGSAIAIPIIAGLIAPQAANAATACTCVGTQTSNAITCTVASTCTGGRTCTGVSCNGGGNNCGSGTCV